MASARGPQLPELEGVLVGGLGGTVVDGLTGLVELEVELEASVVVVDPECLRLVVVVVVRRGFGPVAEDPESQAVRPTTVSAATTNAMGRRCISPAWPTARRGSRLCRDAASLS